MIAFRSGRPARSIATVPDHCDVTETPMMDSTGTAPLMARHRAGNRATSPRALLLAPPSRATLDGSAVAVHERTVDGEDREFGPDVPRSIGDVPVD
jgi:hypothetical protein